MMSGRMSFSPGVTLPRQRPRWACACSDQLREWFQKDTAGRDGKGLVWHMMPPRDGITVAINYSEK
jgi:hypothetical protein